MSSGQRDEYYMQMALDLAGRAMGRTSPNPMVGAVVVKDDQVVGRGYHARAGTPHAEIHALREAGAQARGATLYVTLEPCCHHGRTGPCTDAILAAGVGRVVAAMTDPNPLVSGRGLDILSRAGVEVKAGVLEDRARRLNEVFIKYITTRRPFVVAKAAMSLDGKIATRTGESRWITGPEARLQVHRLRDRYDAILVGINTVLRDNPSLTTRLPEGGGKDPVRVIVDSRARTPPCARVLTRESAAPTIVAVTREAPVENLRRLENAGAQILVVPGDGPRVDLAALMAELGRREITSVLIEGGGEIHASALYARIVDKVIWFIAPLIIGGREAPGPVGGMGPAGLDKAFKLSEVTVTRYGTDICVEGYVQNGCPLPGSEGHFTP
ncbi:bifunctional diaminohydroxyphosphoribosylaminopyrimidine deaminase/5-amino-6-(5-phosphoribosylamino)uracil reductase RibD [Desulfofundulus thermobenzoicus]|uniref:Riboflavin biosynthesis protein RibD n=1 Tax=Desulfofundulus thermobenzoicus TaxID=29376 RepID=A0A6N7IU49_9FIRM|nr:bifunctional diaminohydroxyphosphoribosylaminopyrimidine deaminase/5-amino-6-(5-phosphoribosylamino)uracil reductase RibD [Desulfofundulus thermobenzoicus]MQL53590.1 bifunctional diaminohydroxyphosphoribosylaminopyrimidine deaminase/5-amino-6-(5-phosphoribosylamino)uracil reductase RibD [Desulfofundulus thermobenzoicus]